MTDIRRISVALVIAAVLVACSGHTPMRIRSAHDEMVRFSILKTYKWLPATQTNPSIDTSVRRAVDPELSVKGYQKKTSGDPDFLVTYSVTKQMKREVLRFRSGSGPPDQIERDYMSGTLILDVLQPDAKRIFWRGSAEAEIQQNMDPMEREALISRAVTDILKRFPPQ